ncbi:hypothetical protein MUP35_00695, partial [Patescibacteria group bacterium]|nr:hypothetical protein [Patescibacteria group bacterium]
AEDKEKVEAEVKNVKDILAKESSTKEEIDQAANKLSEELQKVGAAMYQAQQQAGGPQQPTGEEEKKEETPKEKSSSKKTSEDKAKAEEGEVVE